MRSVSFLIVPTAVAVLTVVAPPWLKAQNQGRAEAALIEDAAACDDACLEKLRDVEYRLAIAVAASNVDLESSVMQARKLDRSEPYRSFNDTSVTEVKAGQGVLWELNPLNVAKILWPNDWNTRAKEGFEMRVRAVSKTKGTKACPSVKIRMPANGRDWEQYDPASSTWSIAPWSPSKQALISIPLQGLRCR